MRIPYLDGGKGRTEGGGDIVADERREGGVSGAGPENVGREVKFIRKRCGVAGIGSEAVTI